MKDSQCARVLSVLSDGFWHSIDEIHARAGSMRLNSRVADLRAKGFVVEHRQKGELHQYRLLGRDLERTPGSDGAHVAEPAPRRRRFVPVEVSAAGMVGDGAGYRFAVLLAPDAGRAWVGGDAGLLLTRDSGSVTVASPASPPIAFPAAADEDGHLALLSLEAA